MDKQKFDKLIEYIKNLGRIAVCYSGGNDSFLLLHICTQVLGFENAIGIFCDSDFVVEQDRNDVAKTYSKYNIKIVKFDPYTTKIVSNDPSRCAHCKEGILKEIIQRAKSFDFTNVADGANCTDLLDYRPGLKVSNELRILHPYIECEMTGYDVLDMLEYYKLNNFKKPANACYASRIKYGVQITPQLISRVIECERIVAKFGFKGFRVRVSEDTLRLELDKKDLSVIKADVLLKLNDVLKDKFKYITLDLGGYRWSGLAR